MRQLKTMFLFLFVFIGAGALSSCDFFSDSAQAMAVNVKDKDSLKAFVLSAKEHLEKDYDQAVSDFRTKEEWKKGAIYLYGLTMEGASLFHTVMPELEGKNLLQDPKAKIPVQLALSAIKNGGDFIEYEWDNPAIEGADDSKKVGYVTTFKKDGVDYIVGSGFYLSE